MEGGKQNSLNKSTGPPVPVAPPPVPPLPLQSLGARGRRATPRTLQSTWPPPATLAQDAPGRCMNEAVSPRCVLNP